MTETTRDFREHRGSILVIDDEKGPRESLRMILSPAYRVTTAADGIEGMRVLRDTPIDLVTLDLNMPGIGGEELMRAVRREFPNVAVIVITGHGTVDSAAEGVRFGISDYIQKPFDVVKVTAAVTRALSGLEGRRRLVDFLDDLGRVVGLGDEIQEVVGLLEQNPRLQSRARELVHQARPAAPAGKSQHLQTVGFLEVLAETIESQHTFMHGHAQRTAYLASLLADRLCLGSHIQEQIRFAGFLHDVGKIGVPTELLIQPRGLSPTERALMERHPDIGAKLVEPLGMASEISTAIRHHHEWWDGRGYPDGLYGEQIPLPARIVAIADAYDAMSSDRPYRRALAPDVVRKELDTFAGVQFDPDLAKEFLAIIDGADVDAQLMAAVMASTATPAGARAEAR